MQTDLIMFRSGLWRGQSNVLSTPAEPSFDSPMSLIFVHFLFSVIASVTATHPFKPIELSGLLTVDRQKHL